MEPDSPDYFSPDYATARRRFTGRAETAGARLSSEPIEARGPSGEPLTIDTAYFGPDEPSRLLAVSSGVHGTEGFAGSALQLQFMDHCMGPLFQKRKTGILLVHAVNPYGFAHLERVNENNVDLNRNFCEHPVGHTPNPGYDELVPHINPAVLDEAETDSRIAFRQYAEKHGLRALQSAIASGQYNHPKGLYYGGTRPEASSRHLRQIARTFTRTCRKVAWVDMHTGLGEFGEVSVITDFPYGSDLFCRLSAWYGDTTESTQSPDGISTVTRGSLDVAVLWEFPDRCEGTLMTAEFGTYEASQVFWALRARNWLRHYGDSPTPQGQKIIEDVAEAFNPASQAWRKKVLENGHNIFLKTIRGLME